MHLSATSPSAATPLTAVMVAVPLFLLFWAAAFPTKDRKNPKDGKDREGDPKGGYSDIGHIKLLKVLFQKVLDDAMTVSHLLGTTTVCPEWVEVMPITHSILIRMASILDLIACYFHAHHSPLKKNIRDVKFHDMRFGNRDQPTAFLTPLQRRLLSQNITFFLSNQDRNFIEIVNYVKHRHVNIGSFTQCATTTGNGWDILEESNNKRARTRERRLFYRGVVWPALASMVEMMNAIIEARHAARERGDELIAEDFWAPFVSPTPLSDTVTVTQPLTTSNFLPLQVTEYGTNPSPAPFPFHG